eukprot:GEMP01117682.1.p1 GENE.GEMP01117682.1~~GEMP01117682.1.p1  ORF type:complete len:132 (+),score=22.00 GEMP01117682.1:1-396(+)
MAGAVTIQTYLNLVCEKTDGLKTIVVTDRDGVEILRAPHSIIENSHNEQIMTTIFSLTTEQTSKIRCLGVPTYILTCYNDCSYIQVNHLPLVITLTLDKDTNIGSIIDLLPQIKGALDVTKETIAKETEKY